MTSVINPVEPTDDMAGWQSLIRKHGPMTIIALGLTLWLTRSVSSDMKEQTEAISANAAALQRHDAESKLADQETRFFLRQICVNTADNESERAACIGESRR